MTQVSRMPLPKHLEQQMHTLFRRSLAQLHSEADVADFLEDLLTPTERTMLGKRLAIAVLLAKGYDQRSVHSIMKVSVATVNSVNYFLKHHGKGYRNVIGKVLAEAEWKDFLGRLEEELREFHHKARSMTPWVPMEKSPRDELL